MAANIDYSAIDDEELTKDDLLDVLQELTPIDRKADKLGIALGLSAGSYDPTMNSVVGKWLDQDYNTQRHGLPSYRRLVRAVASRVGGSNPALANTIAAKHPVVNRKKPTGAVVSDHSATIDQPSAQPLVSVDSGHDVIMTDGSSSDDDDDDTYLEPYPMKKSPHGLCLVINNIEFKKKDPRKGSEIDERSVSELFTELGYMLHKGITHRNQSAREIISLVNEVADADHSQYDSVVLFFASHGSVGCLYGSDDQDVLIIRIHQILTSSKTLVGKPKIIFLQACRGPQFPEGREVQDDGGDDENLFIPRDSDFFFGYSTKPGTATCLNTRYGSWYVIELCRIMKKYYKTLDLYHMVTAVHRKIATKKKYLFEKEVNGKVIKYKQCPQIVTTLTCPVYFANY